MIDIREIQKRGDTEEEGCHSMLSKRTCDIIIWHDEDMMIEQMTTAMVLVLGCAGTPLSRQDEISPLPGEYSEGKKQGWGC